MYKGYKIQLFPNAEQEALMWKHIDASRFIWNYMLEYQIKAHERGEKHLKDYDMIRLLTPLKKQTDTAWLYEVSNATLQQVCKNLEFAYKTFFDKTNYFPRFKEKGKSKQGLRMGEQLSNQRVRTYEKKEKKRRKRALMPS